VNTLGRARATFSRRVTFINGYISMLATKSGGSSSSKATMVHVPTKAISPWNS